ncbi:F-box/LRR-repeat protein 6 [Pleurodeles waltl]|uniref:F-box/LRR-repeat protein 6 n=1 Tax=Pleurodeles waltl TaxID=8319 RepID=UPI0037099D00
MEDAQGSGTSKDEEGRSTVEDDCGAQRGGEMAMMEKAHLQRAGQAVCVNKAWDPRTGDSAAVVDECLRHPFVMTEAQSSEAGHSAAAEEACDLETIRVAQLVAVEDIQGTGTLKTPAVATMEGSHLFDTSVAADLAIVEVMDLNTSGSVSHDGLSVEPSCSNETPPSRKRKAGAGTTSKNKAKPVAVGRSGGLKKKKQSRMRRQPAPKYIVQETDNDMLLIISNNEERILDFHLPKKASKKKKKILKKKPKQSGKARKPPRKRRKLIVEPGTSSTETQLHRVYQDDEQMHPLLRRSCDGRWGEQLPVEILVRIFHFLVGPDGAVPSLCRVSRVCRLWQGAAGNPILWQKVSMSLCWTIPQKKLQEQNQRKALATVQWLAENRFSLLQDFALHHWKNHVPQVVQILAQSCRHLTSLKLSHCTGITTECLTTLAKECPKLESLNLQNSQADSAAVVSCLDVLGLRMRCLWLTYGSRLNSIFAKLSSGCCSELRFLEVTTEIKQGTDYLDLSIEALQAGCPKLQVLRLLNVIWSPRSRSRNIPSDLGFPELEELSLATSSFSFIGDDECLRILQTSTKLRVLDLRGCYRVSPNSLQQLPCPDLENLYMGLFCSPSVCLAKEGSHLIAWKWPHSLRELDLMGQGFSEEDLELAIATLASDGNIPVLRSLNLASTKITLKSVRDVILSCPLLTYLNLTSCRCLPRGMKRAYSGQQDIQQCLQKLLCGEEEAEEMHKTKRGATRIR